MVQRHTQRRGAGIRSWPQLGRLLSIALLWQGPFPVIHTHAEFEDGAQLAAHLQRYHGVDEPACRPDCRECHVHFMPVRTPEDEGPDDPDAPTRAPGSSTLVVSVGATAGDSLLHWADLSGMPTAEAPSVAARPLAGHFRDLQSFWGNFACELSLPERLGVIRS